MTLIIQMAASINLAEWIPEMWKENDFNGWVQSYIKIWAQIPRTFPKLTNLLPARPLRPLWSLGVSGSNFHFLLLHKTQCNTLLSCILTFSPFLPSWFPHTHFSLALCLSHSIFPSAWPSYESGEQTCLCDRRKGKWTKPVHILFTPISIPVSTWNMSIVSTELGPK